MSIIVRKSCANYVQEPTRACRCSLIYLQISTRISKSLQRTSRFLGAKARDNYPNEAKGGRKVAVTLLFFPISTRSICESMSNFFSPSSRTALQVAHVVGQVVSCKEGRYNREGAFHRGLFVIVGQSVFWLMLSGCIWSDGREGLTLSTHSYISLKK